MALPAIAAGIMQAGLAWAIGRLIFTILKVIGVGYITYTGIDTLLSMAQSYINSTIGGVPANVVAIANTMNVFAAINMLISAVSIRYTLLWSGRKLQFNRPDA